MPSTSFKERATSPKERIIPIKIENEPKWENDSLDKIKYNKSKRIEDDNDEDKWEVSVDLPKKKGSKKYIDINENPIEMKKNKSSKNDGSKVKNVSVIVNDDHSSKKDKSKKDSTKSKADNETTITTQPSKSILKHPIASSTPIPVDDDQSSWLNRSTASTGTVVRKPTSLRSRCRSWFCMPCSLCCACSPFECECCDCCYLRCTRCEQFLCQCCSRKCC